MAVELSKTDVDYKALTECCSDVVMQIGPDNELIYVSPAVSDVLGWSPNEISHRHMDLLYEEDRERVLLSAAALHSGRRQSSVSQFRVYRKDGKLIWVEGAAHKLTTTGGGANGLVLSMRDISVRMDLQEELKSLTRTDGLTGLANRRTFNELLEKEWAIARREKTPLSLLFVNLDRFRFFNDHCGNQVGDDCLRDVAGVLVATARRPADLVCRYGGDQLALVLPRTHADGVRTIGEYIRIAVEDLQIPNQGNTEHGKILTLSVGAATALHQDGAPYVSWDILVATASQALAKAKSTGRNRVDFSPLVIKPAQL
ncbi:GGDEF domain-containing protein [Roseibium sp. CAU 1637]|uniref:GGDEF domain-containing protein n=1 Tax=Roseibium limicola TaxID=2816037 RepID=A0A939ENP3_9HYPH|nr:sensor domain-containing diguanylate cyclase [Roseibium limicola]MBO0345242.1 GGDEF domain-containing protein [Roseibium limicola]